MAKQLTINDPVTGVTYTLEYTRKSVETMERNGFVADDIQRKPVHLIGIARLSCPIIKIRSSGSE